MLGDMVYCQRAGLPIGGPLSDVGSNLLLTLQEATWRNCHAWRAAAGFNLSLSPAGLDEDLAAVRYVDDVLAISGCLCSGCLQRLVTTRHLGVPFGLEGEASEGGLRWLDLHVRVSASGLHLTSAMSERSWVTGGADAPQVFRVQPYLGARVLAGPLLRCHIRGRLSRWAQLQLAEREVARSLLNDLLTLDRAGYPPGLCRALWLSNSAWSGQYWRRLVDRGPRSRQRARPCTVSSRYCCLFVSSPKYNHTGRRLGCRCLVAPSPHRVPLILLFGAPPHSECLVAAFDVCISYVLARSFLGSTG